MDQLNEAVLANFKANIRPKTNEIALSINDFLHVPLGPTSVISWVIRADD